MGNDCEKRERAITLATAFLLPMLLAALSFASVGIYPFGEKSLLIVDMYGEYIDYLARMNEALRTSGSFLRSWSMGMGLNMLGLIAFYTASPFNLLVLLAPLSVITEAVFAVTLLKLGSAGGLFALFALRTFPDAGRIFHVLSSAAYALSAYNLAYSSNIMWLDGSAFLPLVLLGAEILLRGGRGRLLFFSLLYVFFTSYYIGYMIGVFTFLYLTARYFTDNNDLRAYLRLIVRLICNAALAAGCLAFLLLPAFLNLRSGQAEMWSIPFEPRLRFPMTRLAAKLLPGAYDSLTNAGLPNIYCTIFGVSLCFLYFCAKSPPIREKLILGGLLGFIALSFSCEYLDVAWHAFEEPTWFPARYSFVFTFTVLFLALKGACLLNEASRREIIAAVCLPVLLFIEVGVNRFYFVALKSVIVGIILVCAYGIAIAAWPRGRRRGTSAVLVILVSMEIFANSALMVMGMDRQFEYRSRGEYHDFMRRYGEAARLSAQLDGGVYRTELLGQRNANGSMALGYRGIAHYSTTTDQTLNSFLRALGYNTGTINELWFSASTPLTNGILGIKHILSPKPLGGGYVPLGQADGITVFENTAAWPLAFWAPKSALDFSPRIESGPFELQNELVEALTGISPVFTPISAYGTRLDNAERGADDDYVEYRRQIRDRDAAIGFLVENPGQNEAYAFFPVYDDRFSGSEVFVGGEYAGRDLMYRSNSIIPLGNAEKSRVDIIPRSDRLQVESEYFAALDLDAAKNAAANAASHAMVFNVFSDTRVEGSITSPKAGILATTFPYDEGWVVEINGRRVQKHRLAGVFLAVELPQGTHLVSMRYSPPGFLAGIAVSLVTIVVMLIISRLRLAGGGFHSAFFLRRKK